MPLSLQALRQTTAELLACAVCDLFPDTLLVQSSVSDVGFSYDFIFKHPFDSQSFSLIEERMHALISKKMPIKTLDMMRQNAIAFLTHHNQPLKAESLLQYSENIVQVFQMEHFADLVTHSVAKNSSEVKTFKLLEFETSTEHFKKIGKSCVTRIYGTAFPDPMALKKFLKRNEAAKKKDHRTLGQEMNLFHFFNKETFLLAPNGVVLQELLLRQFPFFLPTKKISLQLKCEPKGPAALMAQYLCSNPAAFSENYEVFCSHSQPIQGKPEGVLDAEWANLSLIYTLCERGKAEFFINSSLQFINKIIKIFGFDHQWAIVTQHPLPSVGKKRWEKATELLADALKKNGFSYVLDKQGSALSGPKIELRLSDAVGRFWSGPFIGIAIAHTESSTLCSQGSDDQKNNAVLVFQSVLGPLERLVALLVEHFGGEFPFWLAPEQVRILPIGDGQREYAENVLKEIREHGFRVSCDYREISLGEKVHAAEIEKIPHIVIIGEVEKKSHLISIRKQDKKAENKRIALDLFLKQLREENKNSLENVNRISD